MHRHRPRLKIIVWLLIALSVASFSFGLGAFVSHATVTVSGSGITGNSAFNSFTVPGTPPASSSSSLLELGPNAIDGSASGTFIGINPSSFSGDFLNFQVGSSTKFAVDALGNLGVNEVYGSTVATPYPNLSFTSSGGLNINAGGTNQSITLSPSGSGATVVNNLEDKGGQVYNVLAYGARNNATFVIDGAMTSGSTVLTSTSGLFTPSDVGMTVVVAHGVSGSIGGDLKTTIASYQSATQVTLAAAAANTVSSASVVWGSDNTNALNSLLTRVYNNGGGTIYFPPGKYLATGQLVVPNNGASPAFTNAIRLEGTEATANGYWTGLLDSPGASVLDLTDNIGNIPSPAIGSTVYGGKIQTDGLGRVQIDHLAFMDTASDCGVFIADTYTTLDVEDNSFYGTNSGSAACNAGINLGKGSVTGFSGFQTHIVRNFFSNIEAGVWAAANGISIEDNTFSKTCGGFWAIAVSGGGNYIANNLAEDAYYTNGTFWDDSLTSNFAGNVWIGNATWDAGDQTYAYYIANPRTIVILGHDDEISRGGISHLFAPGSVIPVGAFSFGNLITTVVGASAGNVYWSTPIIQNSDKRVILNFQEYENTTTIPQTINVTPVDFAYTPNQGNGCPSGLAVDSSTVTLPTSMSSAFTGQCVVEGQ